jgi:orotate phosphoribosyltransferase
MVASFTYGFPVATEAFEKANVQLETLTDYQSMLNAALQSGYIKEDSLDTLNEWRKNPSEWGK